MCGYSSFLPFLKVRVNYCPPITRVDSIRHSAVCAEFNINIYLDTRITNEYLKDFSWKHACTHVILLGFKASISTGAASDHTILTFTSRTSYCFKS